MRELDPILGGGYVTYCSPTGNCHRASRGTIKFANGLVRGVDGLIYVPSSVDGKVRIFRLDRTTNMLIHLNTIELRMPLDNLAVDANGDIWVPGAPDAISLMRWIASPQEEKSPNTVLRISLAGGWNNNGQKKAGLSKATYKVDKILEDAETKVMSGITTVRTDVKTGRLFMGGK